MRKLLEVIDNDTIGGDEYMNGSTAEGTGEEHLDNVKRCLGLLRELFFMTRLMSVDQRSVACMHGVAKYGMV